MERLKHLRESKNMTQVRLGIELGVSQETISGYEINKATPPADMLVKLADSLDTSVDYLLGRTDVKEFNTISKSDLSYAELELLSVFRKLPDSKKERVIGYAMALLDKETDKKAK
ncbi:helix-turn-helix protein [Natranaerovirga pectinivora]|uniref:Helix-turn-helix protein n=1 Tax=Natranaerovirga pectinivora TaxID=682400 RepID=A0A4R3MN11_9FIRM|nr:helix-turn-helix transcriptional regulator [Natranaerovirga pectinivora]TCT15655.1 helix-turn-helix protein [Natranaerovirga pectinivora]